MGERDGRSSAVFLEAFEKAIEQPLEVGQGARTDLRLRYPDNEVDLVKRARGTNVGYLMGRQNGSGCCAASDLVP